MTDQPESVAHHFGSQPDARLDALINAVKTIYGEEIPGVGKSIRRYDAIKDLAYMLIQLIAADSQREKIADSVRQAIKIGVRRVGSKLSVMQPGGNA